MPLRQQKAAEDPLLTTEELSIELNVPEGTLKYWRFMGRGPAFFRLGGRHVRYRRSEVTRWLADCGDETLAPAK